MPNGCDLPVRVGSLCQLSFESGSKGEDMFNMISDWLKSDTGNSEEHPKLSVSSVNSTEVIRRFTHLLHLDQLFRIPTF